MEPGPGQCPTCGQSFPQAGGYCPNDGTRVASSAPAVRDDLIGRTLDGRYEIREVLAPPRAGAIGAMYRGYQVSVAREVAIKIVHAQYAGNRDAVERFLYAGRSAAQLVAPAIANTYDVGQASDGTVYVVSELARGRSLTELLGQTMPARRVVGLALQLADALAAAHRQHLVHGDLDPASIVVDEATVGDQLKLLDVGLACSLVPARAGHAAPEVLDGHHPEPRSDLYSLGCILFELLVATPPFSAASLEALAGRHRREPAPHLPPHVPPPLAALVHRLLAKAPADRYATAGDLRAHLLEVQNLVGVAVPRTSSADIALPRTSSNPNIALPRTISNPSNPNIALPRTASADFSQPRTISNPNVAMPRTASADYSQPTYPLATQPPFATTPQAAPPSGRRRLLVVIVVALLASGAGIAAILFAT